MPALHARIGTHPDFLASMLAGLSSVRYPALRALRTRSTDDWTIALLDGWATVADVLTFYSERIANEGYLRTATEHRSVLLLADLVGYEARPGVAAGVHLAFTLDVGNETVIPAGSRARSVPGPGELPQTFETTDPLPARATLNTLGPRRRRAQVIDGTTDTIYLEGANLHVTPGSFLLIRLGAAEEPFLRLVASVSADPVLQRTAVSFSAEPASPPSFGAVDLRTLARRLAGEAIDLKNDRADRPDPFPETSESSTTQLRTLGALRPSLSELAGAWAGADATAADQTQVWALRVRAPLFGHNAPSRLDSIDHGVPHFVEWTLQRPGIEGHHWSEIEDRISLDGTHEKLASQDWIVVTYGGVTKANERLPTDDQDERYGPDRPLVSRVERIDAAVSRNDYGMAATTTTITLRHRWIDLSGEPAGADFEMIRGAVVYTASEALTLSDMPIDTLIRGDVIELDQLYDGIEPGRTIAVSGERRDVAGTKGLLGAEVAQVAAVAHASAADPASANRGDRIHTYLQLARPLRHRYVRATAVIWGNVAHATNGETRSEVLGSGDARAALQRFGLRQPPLTYVAAPTPSGTETTLETRVNDVRWPEVGSLAELGPSDRGYVTMADDNGARSIVFGDGEHGARLPSGVENVRARYRMGIGSAANVGAGRISLLATKPLGVRDVINPMPATGGAAPDDRDQVRVNAPLPLKALDRLVSVADYADFSRTFAGVGKADATRLVVRGRRGIFVTVAGADDIPIDADSDLLVQLRTALRRFGDPDVGITVAPRELQLAHLELGVAIEPDRDWAVVEAALRSTLLNALGFRARDLGRDLAESEVLAAAHRVDGVIRCRVTAIEGLLYQDGEIVVVEPIASPVEPGQPPAVYHPGRRLVALEAGVRSVAANRPPQAMPAQLLVLSPAAGDTLRISQDSR